MSVIDTTATPPAEPECSCRFRFSSKHPWLGVLRMRSRKDCPVHDPHAPPPTLLHAKGDDPALWAPVYEPAP